MYKVGDKVSYKTSLWQFHNGKKSGGKTKVGVIEEAFTTTDDRTCYWIVDEPELILENKIYGYAPCN